MESLGGGAMSKVVLIYLFFIPSLVAFASDIKCTYNAQMKYNVQGGFKTETISFCTRSSGPKFFSINCKNNDCEALRSLKIKRKIKLGGIRGNPLFQLCHIVKGVPKRVFIQNKQSLRESTLCFFKDKSFVNVGFIYTTLQGRGSEREVI